MKKWNVKSCSQSRISLSKGTEHWGFQREQAPARCLAGGELGLGTGHALAGANWNSCNSSQSHRCSALNPTERKSTLFHNCYWSLRSCWSSQLGNNWVIKLSTSSWEEQVFPEGKFDFKASANSEHSKKPKSNVTGFFSRIFHLTLLLTKPLKLPVKWSSRQFYFLAH